MDMPMAKKSSK